MDCMSPEMMPCRWATLQGELPEQMFFIDLPPVEQVSRGRELLDLLHCGGLPPQQCSARSSREPAAVDMDEEANGFQMVVKGTFIEMIASPSKSSRQRALSDSALSRRDRRCKELSMDLLAELSDLSTDAPSEPEVREAAEAAEVAEAAEADSETQQWAAGEAELSYWPQQQEAFGMQCLSGDACMAGMMPGMWMQAGYDESAGFYPIPEVPMDYMMPWQWAYDPYGAQADGQFEGMEATPGAASSSSQCGDAAQGEEASTQEVHTGPKTTVLLRNLPTDFTRADLLELLEDEGFEGTFDFIYLPMDFGAKVCLGYAFVNFVSGSDAQRCWDIFCGYSDWASEKPCEVTWGEPCQGLHAHIERYRNSPVMHKSIPEEWKPLIFQDGVRIPFPAPTKSITAPKLRRRAGRDVQQ